MCATESGHPTRARRESSPFRSRCGSGQRVGDLFSWHGVERGEFARDDGAQFLAQLRGLPTAVRTLEALLRLCPVFLSALKTRVTSLGQAQDLTAPVGRIRLNRDQVVALEGPDITAKRPAALRVAVDARSRVQKIVAATPVPASGVPLDSGARALFESAAQKLDARQAIIDFTTGGRHCHAWSQELASHSWNNSKPNAFAAYFRAWSGARFAEEARGITIPMLVLVGEHDGGVTEAAMRATYLADYPGCRLKVLTNSGHYPMQEIPVAFATEVQEFLDPVH